MPFTKQIYNQNFWVSPYTTLILLTIFSFLLFFFTKSIVFADLHKILFFQIKALMFIYLSILCLISLIVIQHTILVKNQINIVSFFKIIFFICILIIFTHLSITCVYLISQLLYKIIFVRHNITNVFGLTSKTFIYLFKLILYMWVFGCFTLDVLSLLEFNNAIVLGVLLSVLIGIIYLYNKLILI